MLTPQEAEAAGSAGASPRRLFGEILRHYRTQAGLSRDQLGAIVYLAGDTVGRIETGQRVANDQFVEACEAAPELATNGALRVLWQQIRDHLKTGPYPGWFEVWPGYELAAKMLRTFELAAVPGLLQTEDYARAMLRTQVMTSPEDIEAMVTARMERQAILSRDKPPMLWAIVDEDVLRRPVGGKWVMKEQVKQLTEAASRPNVVLQIIPLAAGAHQGMSGNFVIAEFTDRQPAIYQDTALRGQIIEDADDIEAIGLLWDTLLSEALPRSASLQFLEEVARAWI